MTIRATLIASAALAAVLASGAAHAALQGRDLNGSPGSFEAYYDTDFNITWLADANHAQTSGYDADGWMSWADANTWAASLSFTDGVNTYDNWRLPTTLRPDFTCSGSGSGASGYGCTGSEMGHLFYIELGGTAGQSILSSSDPDLAKFSNIQTNRTYWSGTEYWSAAGLAIDFSFLDGNQIQDSEEVPRSAWAVSPGDVAAVPEADTWALLLAGLGLVVMAARRRRA